MPATDALIFDAVRTPRGRGKPDGSLHSVKPIDLTTGLIEAVKRRNPGLDPGDVDDIVMGTGDVNGTQVFGKCCSDGPFK